jgi:hypothetical protein
MEIIWTLTLGPIMAIWIFGHIIGCILVILRLIADLIVGIDTSEEYEV